MKFRLHSTYLSIKNEEISVLAVFETSISIGAVALLYLEYGSLLHVAAAASLAPFLLLRTERSTLQALKLVESSSTTLERLTDRLIPTIPINIPVIGQLVLFYSLSVVLVIWITNIASIVAIKFAVVTYNLATNTIESISSIPDNWRRIVLYTDVFSPPEIVPGIEEYVSDSKSIQNLRTSQVIHDIYSETALPPELTKTPAASSPATTTFSEPYTAPSKTYADPIMRVLLVVMAACVYIPAIAYRFSLKSTSLFWSPLFWAFRPIRRGDDIVAFAEGVCKKTKFRIARLFSLLIIAAFSAKLAMIIMGQIASINISNELLKVTVDRIVEPQRLPMWQMAALFNSFLTWWILFKSENFLFDRSDDRTIKPEQMLSFFRRTFLLRNVLTTYTSVSLIYVAVRTSAAIPFSIPQLIWFPWQNSP